MVEIGFKSYLAQSPAYSLSLQQTEKPRDQNKSSLRTFS